MNILVTGGAGYIGSITSQKLLEEGYSVTIIDNFSSGHKEAIPPTARFFQGDLLDKDFLLTVLKNQNITGVIHFAGRVSVAESMEHPEIYFNTNVKGSVNLLEAMRATKVPIIIFSSTAGVYGNAKKIPISENTSCVPANPYAESKYMVEKMLYWYKKIYMTCSVSLRYFNASGATLDGTRGEAHKNETHLIPLALSAASSQKSLMLYGNDYSTFDGTCIRDYIHVLDLARIHVLVLSSLLRNKKLQIVYNVGAGCGYSNLEIIEMIKKITGVDFPIVIQPRRMGDPQALVADVGLIRKDLGFVPRYSDLQTIIETAWKWHKRNRL